jgi:hypothetical protein
MSSGRHRRSTKRERSFAVSEDGSNQDLELEPESEGEGEEAAKASSAKFALPGRSSWT